MSPRFEELDWSATPLGELSLRRRWDIRSGETVHEIKLDHEFLMSSLFTTGERELARRALEAVPAGRLEVAVGGLGLGYTAHAALEDPRLDHLTVLEALAPVIDWHERDLLPGGATLAADPRCRLRHGDFFALLRTGDLDPERPDRRWHAVLVDIDHSPRHLLRPEHAPFYQPDGLRQVAGALHPGGVLALWSNDPPDDAFTTTLAGAFARAWAETVTFPNPLQDRDATNTIYFAATAGQPARG